MDKTEIYIKMADCPEIQDLANWEELETGYWWNGFRVVVFLVDEMTEKGHTALWFLNPEKCANKAVWLPTQDQIQKMLGDFLWTSIIMRDWQKLKTNTILIIFLESIRILFQVNKRIR